MTRPNFKISFLVLALALLLAFLLNVSLGSVNIPVSETFKVLFGGKTDTQTWSYIILDYRLPKAFTAILTGSGLALSGLMMQTLFRNPLAGPFVLGISSGASLGAAILIMGASFFTGFWGLGLASDVAIMVASSLGSLIVLLTVLLVAKRIRDTMALLIIGLMFGSVTSAVVSVLAYFSNAEKLRRYLYWSFGSVGNLSWPQVGLLALIVLVGISLGIGKIKTQNALLLGENYARSMGVHLKGSRFWLLVATGLLAGGITAFAGPIAFVGLAVPHLTRQIFNTTDHKILVPAVLLYGAVLMLVCDMVAQWPGSDFVLPINAITSLVGAPVVIWLLVRKRKMVF